MQVPLLAVWVGWSHQKQSMLYSLALQGIQQWSYHGCFFKPHNLDLSSSYKRYWPWRRMDEDIAVAFREARIGEGVLLHNSGWMSCESDCVYQPCSAATNARWQGRRGSWYPSRQSGTYWVPCLAITTFGLFLPSAGWPRQTNRILDRI